MEDGAKLAMELFDTTQLSLTQAMSGASARQEALADNLANANTPGYVRRDVDFHSAIAAAMPAGRATLESLSFTAQAESSAFAMQPDGNTVDVDHEAAELAKNGLDDEALTQVARARDDILRSAMGMS
jgi:flagellar basal-body rod protein FlgB